VRINFGFRRINTFCKYVHEHVLAVLYTSAENALEYRGENLACHNMGLLGLIEIMSKFDSVLAKHKNITKVLNLKGLCTCPKYMK
jgi:hypothetical protein